MGAVHRVPIQFVARLTCVVVHASSASLLCLAMGLACGNALGQLLVSNTRVIFPAGPKPVEFALSNPTNAVQTVRAWIDSGDAQIAPDDTQAPFFVMPPVSKIQPGGRQTLRISFTGGDFPTGQESLYFLNILNLAPTLYPGDSQNAVRFHTRSRFKVLFRPPGLPGNSADAAQQVVWRLELQKDGLGLTANNPSPYFLSLVKIRLIHGQQGIQELEPLTVAPFSSASISVSNPSSDADQVRSVEYQYVDDYGLFHDGAFVFNSSL